VGALLRLRQYTANRSLWHDESSLALNVVERGFAGLLEPLDYGQAAPPGFLWLVEGATRLLGTGEPVLRLVPLLFGLASLPLFAALSRRCLRPPGHVLALALFSVAGPLVYHASEAKQYAGDLALGLGLLVLALRVESEGVGGRRLLALGVLGTVAPWFSHAAVFVLAGIGLALGVPALRSRDGAAVVRLGALGAVWVASFAAAWGLFFGESAASEGLLRFWAFAFLPLPPASTADLLWLPQRLLDAFEQSAGLRPAPLALGLAAVGAVALARRRPRVAALLGLPVLAVLAASALELYPFFQRFLLFLAPAAILFAAEGTERLAALAGPRSRVLAAACVAAVLAWPVVEAAKRVVVPVRRDEIRPVLAYVAEHARPGDRLWVYYGAKRQFRYYAPRLGLADREVVASLEPFAKSSGVRWAEWPRREAERLRGRGRVWLVFSFVRTFGSRSDEERVVRRADLRARRLDAVQHPGAAAYLYTFP